VVVLSVYCVAHSSLQEFEFTMDDSKCVLLAKETRAHALVHYKAGEGGSIVYYNYEI
jgi:hypothetical protein